MRNTAVWALRPRMRQLVSKLHPPAPPTSSENTQLLKSLQTSFRQELDENHPRPSRDSTYVDGDGAIPDLPPVSTPAATSHIASILSNPLFNHGPTATNANTARLDHLRSVLAQSHALSPAEAASDLSRALEGFVRPLTAQPDRGACQEATRAVLQWFRSADQLHRRAIFTNNVMKRRIIPLLSAARNELDAWQWLRITYERRLIDLPLQHPDALQVEDKLVATLMLMSTWRGDLNEAAQQFLHACNYHQTSGRATAHRAFLPNSWSLLANAIVIRRHHHNINASTYESCLHFSPPWSEHTRVTRELLGVYHPSTPAAHDLVKALESGYETFQLHQSSAKDRARKSIMIALLDAAQLSFDQGRSSETRFLLGVAIDIYPEYLPRPQIDQVRETEPMLERSFALALG